MSKPSVSVEEIRAALEKILASPGFADAGRLGPFLRYIVEETLHGNGPSLKESVLGVEVFQRPADYDPRTDPIVRVEARRLRQRLEEYYAGPGLHDRVRIDLPKGGYVPVFPLIEVSPIPVPQAFTRSRPWWHYALGIAALAAVGITLGVWQAKYMARITQAPVARLAILPFENVGKDPANEPFSDGLTEEIIDRLSRTPGIQVVARSVISQHKGKPVEPRAVAEIVRASNLVEGSVRREGDRVRVTARLFHPGDGSTIWSQTYERAWRDIFAIQDEIAQAIASSLRIKVKGEGKGARFTENLEVYNAYLRGRHQANLYSAAGNQRAIEHFKSALQLDPQYAPAHAGLSLVYSMSGYYNLLPGSTAWPAARHHAGEAIRLNPALAEAHASLGLTLAFHVHDWNASEAAYKRALSLDDESADAHGLYAVSLLMPLGRLKEANDEFRKALDLDPMSTLANFASAYALLAAGRTREAIRQYERLLELENLHPDMYADYGMALAMAGRKEDAVAAFRTSRRLRNASPELHGIEWYWAGDSQRAARDLPEVERWCEQGKEDWMDAARLAALLGQKDRALAHLEKAVALQESQIIWMRVDPRLKSLQNEPRLQALAARIGLPAPR